MSKFKRGDKVRHKKYGEGVIKHLPKTGNPPIGVRFEKYKIHLHSLRIGVMTSKCEDGHGWYCYPHEITLINLKKKPIKKKPYWIESHNQNIWLCGNNGFSMRTQCSYIEHREATQMAKRLANNLGIEFRKEKK